ncbi:hypothetical protein CR161_10115 [Prosthecochloris sp. ZM]|nr:hypothetical protein CR161_10115 [Prosthecochloris sp. ZM]
MLQRTATAANSEITTHIIARQADNHETRKEWQIVFYRKYRCGNPMASFNVYTRRYPLKCAVRP